MKYNIMTIADLHWGVMDEEEMAIQYEFILDFIEKYPLDLVVIAGDYFDLKLYLNSKRAIKALDWFDMLYNLCIRKNIRLRMFRGTISHDADQMDVFKKYETSDGSFKVFTTCTSELTLPELQCVYCPDELMDVKEYLNTYTDELLSGNSLGFFHGSFDVVLKKDINISEMLYEEEKETKDLITSITFPITFFERIVKYCWLGGHWHDGKQYGNVYYVGSPTQWIHGEDEPKGFGFVTLDTDSCEYMYQKIYNPIAPKYDSYVVRPAEIDEECSVGEMEWLIDKIRKSIEAYSLAGLRYNIRIVYYETEKNIHSHNMLQMLKDAFVKEPHVVIRIKNKETGKKKMQVEINEPAKKDYSFIKDKNMSLPKQIYEFIKLKTGEEVPLDYIERMVQKFNT